MKQPVIMAWDDVDLAEWEKVEAPEERTLELNGHKVTLDLTAEHAKELDDLVAPWLAAGRTVSKPPTADKGRKTTPYYQGMQAFADANGYHWRSDAGNISYSKKLRDAYAAHLAGQGE